MKTVRKTLERLGWPVERMSDRQIKLELYRRWFAHQPDDACDEEPVSVASAKGILVSMTLEGNLDALCWSPGDTIPVQELAAHSVVSQADEAAFAPKQLEGPCPHPDRRRWRRELARDFVCWHASYGLSQDATGWLVDRSAGGIAFIAQADETPAAGAQITPSIHSRSRGVIQLSQATVVRTEPLNPQLSLVCACFDHQKDLGP